VIGRGRTSVGERFVVLAQRLAGSRGHSLSQFDCTVNITIEETSRPYEGGGLLSPPCLSRSHVTFEQGVNCNAGLLTVQASLLPATRSVRLLLSNGRTIVSPAFRVPRRLGGPVGFYYQVVRGPSPIPVSLTELDPHGNALTVLKLPAVVECAKHLKKYAPHGIVRLAHGSVPQGPTFTIRAERYRELGQPRFELTLSESGGEEGLFRGFRSGSFSGSIEEGAGPPGKQVFTSQLSSGCKPQPHEIVYGLLKAPRDMVLAQVSGKLVPLHVVAIPARLHAGGVLAYGAFSPIPTEIVVRDAHGKIVTRENVGKKAKSDTEKCEGEAEG
jgi:hypothetical protein